MDHQHEITKWNQTLARHEIVKKFENGDKIFYQVTKPNGPGDIVSARDWFMISRAGMRGNVWFQGGCSVDYPDKLKGKNEPIKIRNVIGNVIPIDNDIDNHQILKYQPSGTSRLIF